ncbi:unnamed protein product [Acanthoscelides obtectus]|uniref:Anoctamin n=1 Tax=Acanthoscelides obtectus TaxID=200917 RepID=A0A9P0P5W0_ACAOB|nr:unnamed protein product [Acanthoscelides obtectus]CAK1642987.1 Anoctamin-8 [Acanthoscelides obtectus]
MLERGLWQVEMDEKNKQKTAFTSYAGLWRLMVTPLGLCNNPKNHRTQSQYDRHRVTKLVLFEFVNNFLSLFYIGFILRDMEMLRSQLRNMLIMSQAICSFQEIIQPVAMNYYSRKIQRSKLKLSPSISQPKLFKNDKFVEEVKWKYTRTPTMTT